MSGVAEARRELEALRTEMRAIERELVPYKRSLTDVVALASLLDIEGAADIQRQIRLVWQLKLAYDALQMARMSAGDPFAWLSFGVSAVSTAVMIGNELAREQHSSENPQ